MRSHSHAAAQASCTAAKCSLIQSPGSGGRCRASSTRRLAAGTALLKRIVRPAANRLAGLGASGALRKIARELHQEEGVLFELIAADIFV